MKFAQQKRFTPEQEDEIRKAYATGLVSQGVLARRYQCAQGTIHRIIKEKPIMSVDDYKKHIEELEGALNEAWYSLVSAKHFILSRYGTTNPIREKAIARAEEVLNKKLKHETKEK